MAPSTFSWVDVDEPARRKMLDVIALFRTQDTLDELGLGTVRDALANYFFPGTSTIQTRARYFLFIPWIYRELERKKVASNEIRGRVRQAEVRLIRALLKEHDGEEDGVIGRRAQDELKRFPSSIYWVGLAEWGIRGFFGSQDQYHRSLDSFYRRIHASRFVSEEEGEAHTELTNWNTNLPDAPDGWLDGVSMDLTREEASYLRERIATSAPGSLLQVAAFQAKLVDSDFVWENPLVASASSQVRLHVENARDFAEVMRGAALIYNHMLAGLISNKELLSRHQKEFLTWHQELGRRRAEILEWGGRLDEFWALNAFLPVNIPNSTKQFVLEWVRILGGTSSGAGLLAAASARSLIHSRERQLKRNRARLDNETYRARWNGESGASLMDFRWGPAFRLLSDIHEGLKRGS